MVDARATIEQTSASDEFRDFARVVKAALGVVLAYWAQTKPPTHPYRQAARMVVSYLEKRYRV